MILDKIKTIYLDFDEASLDEKKQIDNETIELIKVSQKNRYQN